MMKTCSICNREVEVIKAVRRNGKFIEGCERCLSNQHSMSGDSAAYNRNWQRVNFRKDLVQPNQPYEYVKAYGADKARESGYRDDQIRKYS